jgi:copper(I)-binding protein
MRRTTRALLAMIAFSAVIIGACSGDDGEAGELSSSDRGTPVAEVGQLAIHGPYVPAPPTEIATLYFVVVNESDEADRLIGISTTAAGTAMLHQTVVDGDSSRMSPVKDGLKIPPGGEAVLAPGGYHVMLMSLVEPLEVDDIVQTTLEFEHAGTVTIEVPVIDAVGGQR